MSKIAYIYLKLVMTKMKRLIWSLFFIGVVLQVFSQETLPTYKFRPPVDITLGTLTISMGTLGMIKHKRNQPFTEFEINDLAYKMNKLDYSSINRSYNKKIQLASDIGLVTLTAAPLLLLADKKIRSEAKVIIPMWVELFAFNFGLVGMTKELVRRTRPYVFYDDVPLELKIKKDARASFFSGHTSMTTSSMFFIAKVYADSHPKSRFKPLMWTGAAVLPLTIGALRYGGGKHFWSDILVGYLVGASTGILIPHLHRNR